MYIFKDKIYGHDNTKDGKQFVVLRSGDYPNDPELPRTLSRATIYGAISDGKTREFENFGSPDANSFVCVQVDKLRKFRPAWCLTNDDLLAQYEARQRDDADSMALVAKLVELTCVDIFKDPDLKARASTLWSAKLQAVNK